MTANLEVNLYPAPHILDGIVSPRASYACSENINRLLVCIPDLETPYSQFSNINHSVKKDQAIRAITTEHRQQLAAVLHDISELDAAVDKLRSILLQPLVLSLPTEVLCQIFLLCLPETDHLDISSNSAPVLLTRICRRWREIAVDMPSLWCRLVVRVPRRWEQRAFCYDLWLKRSRGRPIALEVWGDAIDLQNLLQPYMNQISSITLIHAGAHDLLKNDFTGLQELTIKQSFGLKWYSPAFSQTISRLPCTLRSFRFNEGCMYSFYHLCSFNPIWINLTYVEVGVLDPYIFLRLLELGLNLCSVTVTVGLEHWNNNINGVPALEPLTHTKLQSLSINCIALHAPNSLLDLLEMLSLPNLRMLEAHDIAMWWPHEVFKAFLARSNCPLERLLLGSGMTTDEQRAEYIALIPSLGVVVGPMGDVVDNINV